MIRQIELNPRPSHPTIKIKKEPLKDKIIMELKNKIRIKKNFLLL